MGKDSVAAPHMIAPLAWTTWNNTSSKSPSALSENQPTVAALIWNDAKDPLQLKSKPYMLQNVFNDEFTVRLDLPPPSHLELMDSNASRIFRLSDFTILPSESKKDAADSGRDPISGKPLSLTLEQRQSLKLNGHIHVPSRRFASQNQFHTWQVARCFYSGTRTILDDFGAQGCGKAIDHFLYAGDALSVSMDPKENGFVVTVRSAVDSFVQGVCSFWRGLTQIFRTLDQSKYSFHAIEHIVVEARDSYVQNQILQQTAEEGSDDIWDGFPEWLLSPDEKCHLYFQDTSYIDHLWDALTIDGEWTMGVKPTKEQLNAATRATNRLISLKRSFKPNDVDFDGASGVAVEALTSTRAARRFLTHQEQEKKFNRDQNWVDLILSDVGNLGPYAQCEVDRIQAKKLKTLMHQEDEDLSTAEAEEKLNDLCTKSRFLSLSTEWKRRQFIRIKKSCQLQLEHTFERRLIERLQMNGLKRMAQILLWTKDFDGKYRSKLLQKLEEKRIPLPSVIFNVLQFNPNNWGLDGDRYKKVEVSLLKPGWRLRYAFMNFWSVAKNMIGGSMHFLSRGPLSFRALLGNQSYLATPVDRYPTQTLRSRIKTFWLALSDVRQKFEAEPDTGLIGKSVVRIFLRGYLAVKAILGSVWIISFMTVGTLLASLLAASFTLLGPLVGAAWALLMVIFDTLVYDTAVSTSLHTKHDKTGLCKHYFDKVDQSDLLTSPLVKMGILFPFHVLVGGIQLAFALLSGLAYHPFVALARTITSGTHACLRIFRDTITWPILKRAARVPTMSDDTWLAYRTHGPGLASETYFRLPPWSAKTAVLFMLDGVRLDLHDQLRRKELDQPYISYTSVFQSMEHLGMACNSIVKRSSNQGGAISDAFFRSLDNRLKVSLNPSSTSNLDSAQYKDAWERSFHTLLSHHPDCIARDWDVAAETPKQWYIPVKTVDEELGSYLVKRFSVTRSADLKFQSPLTQIMQSIAPTYASWLTQKEYRQMLLNDALHVPPQVRGRFRLSNDELDDLWQFALHQVEVYSVTIQKELEQIAEGSPWLTNVDAATTIKAFNHKKESIAVLALQLLCKLFGETSMIETLEDLDETLVLDVGIAREDLHLMIWLDNTGSVPSDVGPWHKLERVA